MYNTYLQIEVDANNLLLALRAQITTIVKLNPDPSVCDSSKRRGHVVGFNGGIRARNLRGTTLSKAE